MMKTIVEINNNNYASTGNVVLSIARQARIKGYRVYTCCRKSRSCLRNRYEEQIYIGTWFDRIISERLSYIFGLNGYFNVINTFLFINRLKKIKPDLIHIHSLCDNYLNIAMLFRYLRKNNIPTIWTLHDNWAFTGRCAQFRCDKWMEGCGNCPHKDFTPATLFLDNTRHVWEEREKLYNSLKTMTLVTPSAWLAELTKVSLFKDVHPVKVINNGINLDIFKPIESDFRKKYHLENKHIILGVASFWNEGKGVIDFINLSKELPDNYQIVLVGSTDFVTKETGYVIPDNIISIKRTFDQNELAQIYSSADLFVNPTTDENFPTVNMEAIACGLPVLTYAAGGSAEIIDESCGRFVTPGDYQTLKKEIIDIIENKPFTKENCLKRAQQYNMVDKFNEYVELYDEMLA